MSNMTIERVQACQDTTLTTPRPPIRECRADDTQPKSAALSKGDDFETARKVEHEVINAGASINNAIKGSEAFSKAVEGHGPFPPLVPLNNVGAAMKGSAKSQALTSVLRNGISVAMKKETLAQAGGHVAGDVSVAAIDAGVSAVAGNIAMGVAAAVGASSFPILLTGMAAGYVATKIMDKKVNYKHNGLYEKIVNKTTDELHKAGVK